MEHDGLFDLFNLNMMVFVWYLLRQAQSVHVVSVVKVSRRSPTPIILSLESQGNNYTYIPI